MTFGKLPLWQASGARFMPPVATEHPVRPVPLERFAGNAEAMLMRLLVFCRL